MSFLQPWMLFALPLAALPIIIHLINQRRYQTTQWAAMMFLLAANRMNRGYARVRQWAILALRTMVIAALVFAVGRPLSSGLLGGGLVGSIAGGGNSGTIVLLDRSPSMQQRDGGTSLSKLEAGVAKLTDTLQTMNVGRVVLIESNTSRPRELQSPAALSDLPIVGPSDATADVPAMLLAALDYIRANEVGQADIWICSDLRDSDWLSKDGRWTTLREAFVEFGRRVRFRLLAFPEAAPLNRSVRVEEVRLDTRQSDPFVSLSLKVTVGQPVGSDRPILPVTVELDGARSTIEMPIEGAVGELKNHRIPVSSVTSRGWGRVSVPADSNESDNDFYFTFDVPPPRRTVVVTADADVGRVLKLAAEVSSEDDVEAVAEVIEPDALASVEWDSVSLVLWNAPIFSSNDQAIDAAPVLESFVLRGGSLVFFPPDMIQNSYSALPFGIRWGTWSEPDKPIAVASWRGDADLLAATLAGASLPLGTLRVDRFAMIEGEATRLATLTDGSPLLVRVVTPQGGMYVCATTPRAKDSSFAADGVALYVMIQRAIAAGEKSLRNTRQLDAGEASIESSTAWKPIAGHDDRLSTERTYTAGVYANDNQWWAVNRSADEDRSSVLSDTNVAALFRDLSIDRVDQTVGSSSSIVEEVWRAFLIIMLIAMIGEACLCLPRRSTRAPVVAKGLTA